MKINKSVLSHLTFHLEDGNQKLNDSNEETFYPTCQLLEM